MSTASTCRVEAAKYSAVPGELKSLPQWVCWRYVERDGRKTKMPIQVDGRAASSTDPQTWNTFEACAASGVGVGIGLVVTTSAGIVGIDFDKVIDQTGQVEPWAEAVISELGSYTEISPSGSGVRIFARGSLDPSGPNRCGRVEVYDRARFLTVTGNTDAWLGGSELRKIDAKALQARLPSLDPAPRVQPKGSNIAARQDDPSREDYRIIGKLRREHPAASAAEIERLFAEKHAEQYRRQNAKHHNRGAQTYIGYCIARQVQQDARKERVPEAPAGTILARPDMPEGALQGCLGEIYRRRLSDLPIAYAWPALLAIGGAMVPASSAGMFTASALRTNLFAALVGDVGTGKSTAVERARLVLGVSEPVWCPLKAGSAEGLAQELGDADGAARVLFPDELGHLLDKAKIDGASFPRVLNSLYYEDGSNLVIARGKSLRFNARLSLIGGVVEDDFANTFSASTVHGLYSRTIFGLCPAPYTFLWRPFSGAAEKVSPRRVGIRADIWEARDEWVKRHGIHPRDAEHALRVAYICAAFDGRELKAADLAPAFAFAHYQTRFRMAFSPSQGLTLDAQCGNRIVRALESQKEPEASSEGWTSLRWLQQRTNASRDFGAVIFNRCLQNLAMTGDLELDFSGRSKRVRLARVGEV